MTSSRLRLAIATGCGIGYFPFAPGTLGSLEGLVLAWALARLGGSWAVAFGWAAVTLVGFWSSREAEAQFGRRDPAPVVIDEVSGQLLGLLFVPPSAAGWLGGFVLFRIFDIWKPYPVRRLESWPGASGIMADDLVAGAYANVVQQLLRLSVRLG